MSKSEWDQRQNQLRELAQQTWDVLDADEKGFVGFGLFPQNKIDPAMRRAEDLGMEQRELAGALMELAARNAPERY
jgi:hypothetical protein